MKILKTLMLVAALLLVPVYAFSASPGYMRISLIEGDAQIKTPEAGDWGIASMNGPVGEGDQIWTPQGSRVELQLNNGTYLRLDENSALQILSMDKDSSQFYLSQGYVYVYYDAPRGSVIQVDTPDASTRAFAKAIFRIDMSEQYTDVAVYKGYVETENNVGLTRVKAGQMVSLGQNTNGEIAPMGEPDNWEMWNKKRNDRILARRGASSRYLPAELSAYSYDFDNSGRWVQVPDYGYVWTPTIVVGASWSPYRDGRWIWRGDDYVWVGSEPWGWAPYHYGRWSFIVNIGWFWVPPVTREVYWSPGYVGWVRTSDYVAWVPLAPGETYYGRGNYGRHSVNITNVNINQVQITNVYRNVNYSNGVTVVNRNTFATASPRIVNIDQGVIQKQIFTKNNFSVGTPAIKPTRESYFASTRTVPQAKLPPQAVRNIQTKQLKQSRPFMKEANKSVLNPGLKPSVLPVNTVTTPRTPGKGKPAIQQFKPDEKGKAAVPQSGPAGRTERQQVKPYEKVRPTGPAVSPADKVEKQLIKPAERLRPSAPASGPTGRTERKQVKPYEKVRPTGPAVSPAGRTEKQRFTPTDKLRPSAPAGRTERQQITPVEKAKPGSPVISPTDKVKKQQVKPVEKVKPGGPVVSPTDKDVKQQVEPEEKKSVAPVKGRDKKDGNSDDLDESPQKDRTKQGSGGRSR